ncbi:MAG TPA: aldehyde dehydrogenase family protein, partial [Steroidobacter sp.]
MSSADKLVEYRHLFIGGSWVAPEDGGMMESIDPSTGRPWALVAYGGAKDIDKAVAAARQAFGSWSRMPGHERAALMRRFADLYRERAPELATLETRDNGRALRESRADIGGHPTAYHWYASMADKNAGRTIPID